MFSHISDFYPTPKETIFKMVQEFGSMQDKTILEPSAGKGDIIDVLLSEGAEVLYCEQSDTLQKILSDKGRFIASDFLTVTSDQISHINGIVMNPPFSKGVEHIIHAYSIAPAGCRIVALCNSSNLKNLYTEARKQLLKLVEEYGNSKMLGDCFADAERKTGVEVAMITINKPGENYKSEFDGFFMEEETEEAGQVGLMPYNVIRDLVNRYVAAVKLYDEQLNTGAKMNALLYGFYGAGLAFGCTEDGKPKLKNDFKKDMQRAGWKYIFNKMNLQKDMTRGVKDTINKFIEDQQNVPFTMKNIYRMLEIIIGTRSQTMDKALVEVFDKITEHSHDNRHNVKGWKTNLHYLVGRKFILGGMCYQDKRWDKGSKISTNYGGNFDLIEDLNRALCFITGDKYGSIGTLKEWIGYKYKVITKDEIFFYSEAMGWRSSAAKCEELYKSGIYHDAKTIECVYGEWFDWGYFRCKAFKMGSMHFEFLDQDLWGKFNQRIAKLKGFPLFEYRAQTAYQQRNAGYKTESKTRTGAAPKEAEILFSVTI